MSHRDAAYSASDARSGRQIRLMATSAQLVSVQMQCLRALSLQRCMTEHTQLQAVDGSVQCCLTLHATRRSRFWRFVCLEHGLARTVSAGACPNEHSRLNLFVSAASCLGPRWHRCGFSMLQHQRAVDILHRFRTRSLAGAHHAGEVAVMLTLRAGLATWLCRISLAQRVQWAQIRNRYPSPPCIIP